MRKLLLLTFVLLASASLSFSQKQKTLTPSRGYYKDLAAFSAEPKSPDEEIDKQKFPFDAASAERRLSLKPYYLTDVKLEDFKIPDPPANSSEQTRAELNYLLALQQQRTKLDIESSLYMAGVFYNVKVKPEDSSYRAYRQNLFHVGRTIGSWFNPDNLPLTADLMAHTWQDASYFIWGFKYKYLRIRPYVIEKDLNNLEDTNWAAYPSGHAANSYINAYIYQELAPEFADVFLKDAYDMAHSREIIGVHYPSDSESSRILARQFVNRLFKNEKFLKDFELVKKEWTEKGKESFIKPSLIAEYKKASSCSNQQTSACAKKCE
ncbi:MAG: phosphatase [Marivirga sp.]|nr:phosphatase [Marivirga sp.]